MVHLDIHLQTHVRGSEARVLNHGAAKFNLEIIECIHIRTLFLYLVIQCLGFFCLSGICGHRAKQCCSKDNSQQTFHTFHKNSLLILTIL